MGIVKKQPAIFSTVIYYYKAKQALFNAKNRKRNPQYIPENICSESKKKNGN